MVIVALQKKADKRAILLNNLEGAHKVFFLQIYIITRQIDKKEAAEVLQQFLHTKLSTDTIWLTREQRVKTDR